MKNTIYSYFCIILTLVLGISASEAREFNQNRNNSQTIQYAPDNRFSNYVLSIPHSEIPYYVQTLSFNRYHANHPGGKSTYERVQVRPKHSSFFISRDGGIWELSATKVTPEMFGAIGNKSFKKARLNDDTAAIKKMIEYAVYKKATCHLVSNYLHRGQINLPGNLTITGTGYKTSGLYCTLKNNESAIVIKNSNVTIGPFQVRAQLTEKKSISQGHIGNCVVIGDFLTAKEQAQIHNVKINVQATRAPHNSLGFPSFTSPAINLIGNVRSAQVICSIKGSSTPHSIGLQTHWGGVSRSIDIDPSVSYHPCNVDVIVVDDIENCRIGVINSSSFNINVSAFTIIKPRVAYVCLPGDNINLFAELSQKNQIGKRINIGHITVKGIESHKAHRDIISITSRGTSKTSYYPKTHKSTVLQNPVDLTIDGFTILNEQPVIQEHGCRISGVIGRVHLGDNCCVTGLRDASVEIENSYGDIALGLIKANSPLKIEFSKGVTINQSKITPSMRENKDSPAIQVIGDEIKIRVKNRGRLVLLYKPLTFRLHTGDTLFYRGGNHIIQHPIPIGAKEILLDTVPIVELSELVISRRSTAKIHVEPSKAYIGARFKRSDVTVFGNGPTHSRKCGYVIEEYTKVKFLGGIPKSTTYTRDGGDFLVKPNTGLNFKNVTIGRKNQKAVTFRLVSERDKIPAKIHMTDSVIMEKSKLGIPKSNPNVKFIESK